MKEEDKLALKRLGDEARAYIKTREKSDWELHLKRKASGYYDNLPVWARARDQ